MNRRRQVCKDERSQTVVVVWNVALDKVAERLLRH